MFIYIHIYAHICNTSIHTIIINVYLSFSSLSLFPLVQVEVDLALSAHANARRWYEQKKKQESKQEKTVTAHEKAFKAAERKTRIQLSQVSIFWKYMLVSLMAS